MNWIPKASAEIAEETHFKNLSEDEIAAIIKKHMKGRVPWDAGERSDRGFHGRQYREEDL